MDTVLARPSGLNQIPSSTLIGNLLNISIIGVIVCSQSLIVAIPNEIEGVKVANAVIQQVNFDVGRQIIEEVSPTAKEEKFDKSIKDKYPKAVIKDIQRGVKHIKVTKYYNGKPVRINIVEADLKLANLTIKPELASTSLNSRKSIKTIAKKSSSIAAINGTYFKPQTGVPLGTLMVDGELITGPIYDRAAFGIFEDGSFDVARIGINASVKSEGIKIKIDNVNQPRMLSSYVLLYTPHWGKIAPSSPKYGTQVVIQNNRVKSISTERSEIPVDGVVLVGPKSQLENLKVGAKVKLDIKTIPEWNNIKHIIGGGPYLVKDGEVFVDVNEQKLGAITGRNPRSAIGYTAQNRLIMVAVDGREGASVGLWLSELAKFMKDIGCVNAINLDGGGSTVMLVGGQIVNNPPVSGGISISNAVVLSTK